MLIIIINNLFVSVSLDFTYFCKESHLAMEIQTKTPNLSFYNYFESNIIQNFGISELFKLLYISDPKVWQFW